MEMSDPACTNDAPADSCPIDRLAWIMLMFSAFVLVRFFVVLFLGFFGLGLGNATG